MKIGLPRALMYYYYYPFFRAFFEALGCEIIVSQETNAKIMTNGVKSTVSEICVPIKIFNGHIIDLLDKPVDYIFIPRFVSMGKREWYCPKFLGITELASYSVPELSLAMLTVNITSDNDMLDNPKDYYPLCDKLGVSKHMIKQALGSAKCEFLKFRALLKKGYTGYEVIRRLENGKSYESILTELQGDKNTPKATIALLGYVYNVYDNYISMNIVDRIRDMHVDVVTFDMLDEMELLNKNKKGKKPYWVYTRKIYNAAQKLLREREIDGIIHLTAFACGPDSILGKIMETDCDEKDMPFMTVRVDEHAGEGHILTRIEAFIDMIKAKLLA